MREFKTVEEMLSCKDLKVGDTAVVSDIKYLFTEKPEENGGSYIDEPEEIMVDDDVESVSVKLSTPVQIIKELINTWCIGQEMSCSCHIAPPCTACVDYGHSIELEEYLELNTEEYRENKKVPATIREMQERDYREPSPQEAAFEAKQEDDIWNQAHINADEYIRKDNLSRTLLKMSDPHSYQLGVLQFMGDE